VDRYGPLCHFRFGLCLPIVPETQAAQSGVIFSTLRPPVPGIGGRFDCIFIAHLSVNALGVTFRSNQRHELDNQPVEYLLILTREPKFIGSQQQFAHK
jgi:hypothetical protein